MYDFSPLYNATGFGDILTTANNFSEGILFKMFIIAVFVILILVFIQQDFAINIAIASFICFLLSIMMSYAGWLSIYFPLGFVVILGLDLLYLYSRRD